MLQARTLSIAVLALAALAVPGCGGDDSGGGGDDEAQIRETVTNYANAVADGDGDKACGFLTKSAKDQIDQAAEALGTSGCAETLEKATEGASDDELEQVKNLEITSVKIDGDRATVMTKVDGVDEADAEPAILTKEDGEWKVAADQSGGAESATVERPQVTAEAPTVATVTAP